MKKLIAVMLLVLSTAILGQNASDWQVRYYGDGNYTSNALLISNGAYDSGVYYITNSGIEVSVDSGWTASHLGFKVYNYLEGVWEILCDKDGDPIEYAIAIGKPVQLIPSEVAGLKEIKFTKLTNGTPVAQSGAAKLQVASIKFN